MLVADSIESSCEHAAPGRQSILVPANEGLRHSVDDDGGAVRYACPHCHTIGEDLWDALETNELHHLSCESCSGMFWLLVRECSSCTHEEAWTWSVRPDAVTQLVARACARCGHIDDDEEGPDGEIF